EAVEPIEAIEPTEPAEPTAAAGPTEPTEAVEPIEPAESAESTYSATVVEPDWFADGDFSWLDAADVEARSKPEIAAVAPVTAPSDLDAPPEIDVAAGADAKAPPELDAAAGADAGAVPEPESEPEALIETTLRAEPHAEVEVEAEPEAEPEVAAELEPGPEAPIAFSEMEPVEVSGAGEEAVMVLGGPHGASDEREIPPAAPRAVASSAPRTGDPLEPAAWPASDRGTSVSQAVAPPLAMTEEELAQLARDEGWDAAEVAAIRAMISRPAPRAVQLPGAAELDEAMSALHAVPIEPHADAPSPRQWAKPATQAEETTDYDDWAFEVEPAPRAPVAPRQPVPRRAAPDPNWLRQRRGPAASAYRRIRRIFSG
ncbi:MAG: hypothetical protein M3P32_01625, partial [Chloroflexota bacterium]|nr:hypothetical protein [Chloroflexota bacterium]